MCRQVKQHIWNILFIFYLLVHVLENKEWPNGNKNISLEVWETVKLVIRKTTYDMHFLNQCNSSFEICLNIKVWGNTNLRDNVLLYSFYYIIIIVLSFIFIFIIIAIKGEQILLHRTRIQKPQILFYATNWTTTYMS